MELTSPHLLAILLDMPRTHVPVLAGELIESLDPQPGQVAVDCTLGAAGHARLVADRIGPAGTLIPIDRPDALFALADRWPSPYLFVGAIALVATRLAFAHPGDGRRVVLG